LKPIIKLSAAFTSLSNPVIAGGLLSGGLHAITGKLSFRIQCLDVWTSLNML
jgi:hypothetical protein